MRSENREHRSEKRDKRSEIRAYRVLFLLAGLAAALTVAGCHSFHIDIAVENQTGVPIRLLEVDYPNASFGADVVAAGATYHYRIQVQGNGPLKVQYTTAVGDTGSAGQQRQIQGPVLTEKQEGTLKIVLLPNGKAEFNPHLSAPAPSSTGN